jgi:hypothetical protein
MSVSLEFSWLALQPIIIISTEIRPPMTGIKIELSLI